MIELLDSLFHKKYYLRTGDEKEFLFSESSLGALNTLFKEVYSDKLADLIPVNATFWKYVKSIK